MYIAQASTIIKNTFFFGNPMEITRSAVGEFCTSEIQFTIQSGAFIIKTLETHEEFNALDGLIRNSMLHKISEGYSFISETPLQKGINWILIIHSETGTLCAAAGITIDRAHKIFLTDTVFDINKIRSKGEIIELGRFFTAREYRSQEVLDVVWKGVIEYGKIAGSRFCLTGFEIKTADMLQTAMLHRYFTHEFRATFDVTATPRGAYRIKDLHRYIEEIEISKDLSDFKAIAGRVPFLMKACLNRGAFVCGEPALLKEKGCVIFLLGLDVHKEID